jgi:enamine deaminase RidA (YjgF/YER057c/UK114 family)
MTDRIQPEGWAEPRGYANGMRARGEIVAVAGQIGWKRERELVSEDFIAQFAQALANVVTVVRTAGGRPEDPGVLDPLRRRREGVTSAGGRRWARPTGKIMGGHYPAMALVQIGALVDPGAKVEIPGARGAPVTSSFLFELDGDGVATVTFDRADRLNALTFEVYASSPTSSRA